MAVAGPYGVGAVANVVGDITETPVSWINLNQIYSNDSLYVTFAPASPDRRSYYLRANYFKPSGIPDSAIINGILATVYRKHNGLGSTDNIRDFSVKLFNGDTAIGNNKASGGGWSTSEIGMGYGSATDTWGVTGLTGADINASGMGVGIACSGQGASSAGLVNYIEITYYYSLTSASGVNNNCTLFMVGCAPQNNNCNLFEQGRDVKSSGINLYAIGSLNSNSNTNCYIYGSDRCSNNLTLYTSGSANINVINNIPLFTLGKTSYFDSTTLFEAGNLSKNSGLDLYIYGDTTFTSFTPPPTLLPLYIAGPINPTGYISLFIKGPHIVSMCAFTRYINMDKKVNLEI